MFPRAVLALPNARFFETGSDGGLVGSDALIEADIGNDPNIAHEPYLGGAQRGVEPALHTAQVEIKAMKFQPFHQVARSFRLKGSKRRIAQLLV
ncbi:MAG TPA: hypothetical protein VGP68_01615, partial [Gemmataceae bacterium]|nr:hypothetical protein [Gemmataceae bacterium]